MRGSPPPSALRPCWASTVGRGIQPTLKSWRGDPDGRSNTGWGQGAKLACRCWWLRWQVSAGKRSREAKEEASSIQTKQPPNAPVSTCLSTVCPHPASGPPGSASARQTTADVELGTWVPGRGVDAAMRTRTLTSEAQTIPHRSHPFLTSFSPFSHRSSKEPSPLRHSTCRPYPGPGSPYTPPTPT